MIDEMQPPGTIQTEANIIGQSLTELQKPRMNNKHLNEVQNYASYQTNMRKGQRKSSHTLDSPMQEHVNRLYSSVFKKKERIEKLAKKVQKDRGITFQP